MFFKKGFDIIGIPWEILVGFGWKLQEIKKESGNGGKPMITVSNLSKRFVVNRRKSGLKQAAKSLFHREREFIQALDNISFTIPDGQVVGYIGPNGAGKSTTVKILSGILTPDSGECDINGRTPWKQRREHVAEIGVVFGQRSQLWWDVPVGDSFDLLRDIYRVPEKRYRANVAEMTERLQLESLLRTPARQLSLGQRMRCEIAASLLHDPKVLFLDEPTIGLDAVSKLAVRDFIREINRDRRVTVILTTHDMQDIEALAQRILLIGKGKVLLDGTLEQLKQEYGRGSVTVSYSAGETQALSGLEIVEQEMGRLTVATNGTREDTARVIAQLTGTLTITDISVKGPDAEEMVVSLYRKYQV